MAYKIASKLQQEKLRRPVGGLLPSYFETLTPEQQRECLVAVVKSLDDEILNERDKFRRKELGKKKAELCLQINAIRPKRHGLSTVNSHFIEVARTRLPKHMFDIIMTEASKRAREENKTETEND